MISRSIVLTCLSLPVLASATPSKTSTADVLRGNAYFVQTSDAILAVEVDGPSVTLARGHISHAAYDPAYELVWFLDGTTLRVLDLRTPDSAPVEIAQHIPEGMPFAVTDGMPATSTDGAPYMMVTLHLQAIDGPTIEFYDASMSPDPKVAKDAKLIKLTGAKWIAAQVGRAGSKEPQPTAISREPSPTHKPPKGAACEADPFDPGDRCGDEWRFGKTGWKLHITRKDQGMYYTAYGCVATDKGGKLAIPPAMKPWKADESQGPCDTYLFDPNGTRWIHRDLFADSQLCSKDGCADLKGRGLGWRHGGEVIAN